jgi:hypothetical protein
VSISASEAVPEPLEALAIGYPGGVMRLFHFSDEPTIEVFEPRPVRIPSPRPAGGEWLNGPLVWAIEDRRQPMYLFPRDCPRILIWPTPATTPADRQLWFGDGPDRIIAHIEAAWLERVRAGRIHRYELPAASFEDLDDAGMWISRTPVRPLAMQTIDDLPAELAARGAELRVMERLTSLHGLWETSLHCSGVRLRHAQDWPR